MPCPSKALGGTNFSASKTRSLDLYLLGGQTTDAPFMTVDDECDTKFMFGSFEDFMLFKLPYKSGGQNENKKYFSMYIFLPLIEMMDFIEKKKKKN